MSKARLKFLKDTDQLRRADFRRCVAAYLPPTRSCIGGRRVVDGYSCVHCNSNSPATYCEQPIERYADCPHSDEEYWERWKAEKKT